MKSFLIVFLVFVLISCSDDDTNIISPISLNGKWIEVDTKSDTLTFNTWDDLEIMILDRGKEVRNGILLPKFKSGSYTYRLSEGKISLNWMLSSNSAFNDYDLKVSGKTMNIGNFYNSSSGTVLTFEKMD